MPLYELTASAQEDLKAIALYTFITWGNPQALKYATLLEKRFGEIATGNAYGRCFSKRFPQILVNRCEHHYIFYVHPHGKPVRIIAVLHENMDLVNRLKDRLA